MSSQPRGQLGITSTTKQSRFEQMAAQFQQKQMQEKEQKLLQLIDNQQQKAKQKANLSGVIPPKFTPTNTSQSRSSPVNPVGAGKVRQMFEERRKGGGTTSNGVKAGIDKSYPLDPLVVDSGKTRSVSSKSDPYASRPPVSTSKPVRQVPHRLTPTPPNLGTSNRPQPQPIERTVVTTSSSRNSSGGQTGLWGRGTSPDENGNSELLRNRTTPSPVPRTTKYTEFVGIESRERDLGTKMKQMSLSSPSSSSEKSSYQQPTSGSNKKVTASRTGSSSKSSKSSSPIQRPAPPPGSVECGNCHRYFNSDRIAKHETICKKASAKKRKVFDPTKMRMQGTEAEPYIRIVSGKAKKPQAAQASSGKKQNWRKQHEDFINTIRAAKQYQQHVAAGGNPNDLPPPPPSDYSDYIQCPHCGRKFSEGAASRHIPRCKTIKSNKK